MVNKGKKIAGRSHKSHFPVMRKPSTEDTPEMICEKRGHVEAVLAQSSTKKVIHCARCFVHIRTTGGSIDA